MTMSQREVSIFWDYENVRLPSWCDAAEAAKAITGAVSPYGRIVDQRLYYDPTKPSCGALKDRSKLDSSGWDLIDTPTRNQKETIDKKMIADILLFAWDSAVRNETKKPAIVLITSDGDYAYTLARIRQRGIFTVVFVGKYGSVAEILQHTADDIKSLEDDVLKDVSRTSSIVSVPSPLPSASSSSSVDLKLELCRHVYKEASGDGWIDYGRVAVGLQATLAQVYPNETKESIKERSKAIRTEAFEQGYVQLGKRDLSSSTRRIETDRSKPNLSLEIYIGLTAKGREALGLSAEVAAETSEAPSVAKSGGSRFLFCRNLPSNAKVLDFVQFLESTYVVNVIRAKIEKTTNTSCHVEFSSAEEAARILTEARNTGSNVNYEKRNLFIVVDTRPKYLDTKGNSFFYYESGSAPTETVTPQASPTNSDSSKDACILCECILDNMESDGEEYQWINGGSAGNTFKSKVKNISAEERSFRYKQARTFCIKQGWIEIGRRRLATKEYVAVPLTNQVASTEPGLSSETYLRLLPAGRAKALEYCETKKEEKKSSVEKMVAPHPFIHMSMLPQDTKAEEIQQYLVESLDCAILSLELKQSTTHLGPVTTAKIECKTIEDASKLLRQAKSTGLIYRGKKVYAVPDRDATAAGGAATTLEGSSVHSDKGKLLRSGSSGEGRAASVDSRQSSFNYDESGSTSNHHASTPEKASKQNNETSNDVSIMCACILDCLEIDGSDGQWTGAGGVGARFKEKLQVDISAEERSSRFKQARSSCVEQGLIEVGRRRLGEEPRTYVAVPLFNQSVRTDAVLSPELYFRLLPFGRTRAMEYRKEFKSPQPKSTTSEPKAPDAEHPFIHMNWLPKGTKAEELEHFLHDTLGCSAKVLELKPFMSPHGPAMSGRVECASTDEAAQILRRARTSGLIYRGKKVFAVPDRNAPSDPATAHAEEALHNENNDFMASPTSSISGEFARHAIGDVLESRSDFLDTLESSFDQNESVATSNIDLSVKQPWQTNNDTAKDTMILCECVLEGTEEDDNGCEWINAGGVGSRFQSKVPPSEERSARFKEARNTAIEQGLIELGRRRLDSKANVYVTVAMSSNQNAWSRPGLSSELYIRLLPLGREKVTEYRAAAKRRSNSVEGNGSLNDDIMNHLVRENGRQDSMDSLSQTQYIHITMLPRDTDGEELKGYFLSSLGCSVKITELKQFLSHIGPAMSAKIECASKEDASKLLKRAQSTGLIYRGKKIFAAPDLDAIWNENQPGNAQHDTSIPSIASSTNGDYNFSLFGSGGL